MLLEVRVDTGLWGAHSPHPSTPLNAGPFKIPKTMDDHSTAWLWATAGPGSGSGGFLSLLSCEIPSCPSRPNGSYFYFSAPGWKGSQTHLRGHLILTIPNPIPGHLLLGQMNLVGIVFVMECSPQQLKTRTGLPHQSQLLSKEPFLF